MAPPRLFVGWRGLGLFWAGLVVVLAAGAGTLQILGPPAPKPVKVAIAPPPVAPVIPKPVVQAPPKPKPPPSDQPGRDSPGPIADPDPGLLEPAPGVPSAGPVPIIAMDGRMPMQVYAAGFDRSSQRPRVGLIVAGIGLNEADSTAAIRSLPGGISLAVSPYAGAPGKILSVARIAEHEYLLSVPMEPQGFPNNDPGPHALMTNLSPEQNLERLYWALSRVTGYAGVTSALGSMRGERFEAVSDALDPALTEIGGRGLYWIDTKPGQGAMPKVWSRSIDLVIDEPASQADIDAKLDQLAGLALDRGAALGLVTAPRPVTIDRIAAWTNGLTARGLALAPVSALLRAPAKKEVAE
jgi:polysaccharide deacetylase 2 family uncharacterized protein YibQ